MPAIIPPLKVTLSQDTRDKLDQLAVSQDIPLRAVLTTLIRLAHAKHFSGDAAPTIPGAPPAQPKLTKPAQNRIARAAREEATRLTNETEQLRVEWLSGIDTCREVTGQTRCQFLDLPEGTPIDDVMDAAVAWGQVNIVEPNLANEYHWVRNWRISHGENLEPWYHPMVTTRAEPTPQLAAFETDLGVLED